MFSRFGKSHPPHVHGVNWKIDFQPQLPKEDKFTRASNISLVLLLLFLLSRAVHKTNHQGSKADGNIDLILNGSALN